MVFTKSDHITAQETHTLVSSIGRGAKKGQSSCDNVKMSLNIRAILAGVGGWARLTEENEAAVSSAVASVQITGKSEDQTDEELSPLLSCHSCDLSEPLQDFTVLSGTTQNTVELIRVQRGFRYNFRNKSLTYCMFGVFEQTLKCDVR